VEIDPALNYQSINRRLWNARTPFHVTSSFYDVPGFIKNPFSLKEIEVGFLGEIRGRTVLHLQCHFGQDTISLGKLGGQAIGLDFSETAINEARQLANATGSDAAFVCADVYEAPKTLGRTFDVVFSSYGAIGWLPDLRAWGRVVADLLKTGGRFVFAEFHPFVWTFSGDFSKVKHSYFNTAPIVETTAGTYADTAAGIGLPSVGWNHPLKDVLAGLLEAGLSLRRFEEYDYSPYNCFQNTVEVSPGRFMIKGMEGKLPMVYALEAIKQ
jgi:SAM-dependent methyltransferase